MLGVIFLPGPDFRMWTGATRLQRMTLASGLLSIAHGK